MLGLIAMPVYIFYKSSQWIHSIGHFISLFSKHGCYYKKIVTYVRYIISYNTLCINIFRKTFLYILDQKKNLVFFSQLKLESFGNLVIFYALKVKISCNKAYAFILGTWYYIF